MRRGSVHKPDWKSFNRYLVSRDTSAHSFRDKGLYLIRLKNIVFFGLKRFFVRATCPRRFLFAPFPEHALIPDYHAVADGFEAGQGGFELFLGGKAQDFDELSVLGKQHPLHHFQPLAGFDALGLGLRFGRR